MPITARKGDVLPKGFVFVIVPQSLIASASLIRIEKREVAMSKPTPAHIKRNNRKIHARKWMATPEGKAWLERRKAEEAEIKLARAANAMF